MGIVLRAAINVISLHAKLISALCATPASPPIADLAQRVCVLSQNTLRSLITGSSQTCCAPSQSIIRRYAGVSHHPPRVLLVLKQPPPPLHHSN
jgi:hypothetical protein